MLRSILPAVVLALTFSLSALAQDIRTISTTGDASVYVAPDEVVVSVGVETFAADLDRAKQENDGRSSRLLNAIKDMQIEQKHIQAANMEIEIRYNDGSHPSRGIEGYYARRAYAITLKDTKRFEALIDTALKNGANQLMGFQYRTTELRKHRDEARRMAIKAAREKAQALAAELGCSLGLPRTIGESNFGFVGYYGWGWNRGQYMAQNAVQSMGGEAPSGETMPLGQIGINAQVSVTFDLVPAK